MEGGRWEGSRIVSEVVVGGGEVEGRGIRDGHCGGGGWCGRGSVEGDESQGVCT